jgi:hypothetical protein
MVGRRMVPPDPRRLDHRKASAAHGVLGRRSGGGGGLRRAKLSREAGLWLDLMASAWCLGNFWCYRETHCIPIGTGWMALVYISISA